VRIALLESFAVAASRPGAAALLVALRSGGHEIEHFRPPFTPCPQEQIADQILAARLIRLDGVDRAIALSFPAGYIPHHNKVVWVGDGQGRLTRADRASLGEAAAVRAGSRRIARQLRDGAGVASEIMYWPPCDAYRCDGYRDHLVALSGAAEILDAFALAAGGLRLYADLSPALLARAAELGVAGRVEALGEGRRRIEALAGSRAVVVDSEDDAGAIEAFAARKAVLAFDPSGRHDGLGLQQRVASTTAELAAAIGELAADASLAELLGTAAADSLDGLDLSWERVAAELAG
jgi:hypothetical protein